MKYLCGLKEGGENSGKHLSKNCLTVCICLLNCLQHNLNGIAADPFCDSTGVRYSITFVKKYFFNLRFPLVVSINSYH